MNKKSIEGVIALVPMVFDEQGNLDLEGYKENIRYLESVGVHGIVAMSSVGEFYALDDDEFKKVASVAREACNKMVCIINCAYQNAREAVARVKYAEDIGADGAMFYTYHYFQLPLPDPQKLYYGHIQLIHEATREIQLVIYNNQRESKGFDVSLGLYAKLAEDFDRVTACAEDITSVAEPAMAGASEKIWRLSENFNVLSLDEAGLFPMMYYGGKGCLATYGIAMPELLVKLYNACKEKDYETALKLHQTLTRYPCSSGELGMNIQGRPSSLFPGTVTTSIGNTHSILGEKVGNIFPGTVTTCKAMAEAAGRKAGSPRLPYLPPSERMRKFARDWLADIG